ncbi:MBL fold metallo-hydrolase [Subtercola lobariae]|uniref:MBL fold metallo-hydrolase n=1 Tax=Subtercola lobariae TaxID=1588641 RepID=A0A917EZD8_9MICO|nr:MBL fold metallo-hydrolase [Subtercola lobariae]GGF36667.1 MBL fold metallo-hydrolase [Subtercola lobariae]
MKLTVLGTSAPFPRPGNACSGYLLASENKGQSTNVWIDAGTGTFAELQRHVDLADIDAIFVSHRHADHSADLFVAYYALEAGSVRPNRRIRVLGPEALADRLAEFLGPDARQGLAEVFDFIELTGWGDAVVGDLTLSWGPVSHGVPAFALTVAENEAEGGSIRSRFTYSGDTAPCTSLVEMAEESSVLLCEVGYAREALGVPAVHHTPEDAGQSAAAAGVETLILTHIDGELEPADAVRRARTHFAGQIVIAEPGASYSV